MPRSVKPRVDPFLERLRIALLVEEAVAREKDAPPNNAEDDDAVVDRIIRRLQNRSRIQ